jgi:hypothetical protein
MQKRELDRATIGVANRTNINGRATADETKGGSPSGKRGNLRRISRSAVVRSLMIAGLFFALTVMRTRADEDNDTNRQREDNDRGIRAEIAALQAQVASLRSTVSGLQGQIDSLQSSNKSLQSQLTVVQSNRALALGPFVTVEPDPKLGVVGPHITFSRDFGAGDNLTLGYRGTRRLTETEIEFEAVEPG